jgi:hypothetical protein
MGVSAMLGKVKIQSRGQTLSVRKYRVTLIKGTEEDLLKRLNNDLSNLVTVCDNHSFDNLERVSHYGGTVKSSFNVDGYRCYDVDVYID